jgi:hypothetical protein
MTTRFSIPSATATVRAGIASDTHHGAVRSAAPPFRELRLRVIRQAARVRLHAQRQSHAIASRECDL